MSPKYRKHGKHLGAQFSHLTMCFGPDGTVNFYPDGDGRAIAEALTDVVEMLHQNPERIFCIAGVCSSRDHDHEEQA